MSDWVEAFAPAKINLTLHVTGQREDGYHLLDSLVVFADVGDRIRLRAADKTSLSVDGPMAAGVPTDETNSVIKAASFLGHTADIRLEKNLPSAAGIGGGTSDAAATIRALCQLGRIDVPSSDAVLALGADVPVCLNPVAQRMRGIGEDIAMVPDLPAFHLVLVNPGREVSTPAVFKELSLKDNPPMPARLPKWDDAVDFARWLKTQRNDLELPARSLCPAIGVALARLEHTDGCLLARMSGSGATCFGIYATSIEADSARAALSQAHPDWWVS